MAIRNSALSTILNYFGASEGAVIFAAAQKAEHSENKWVKNLSEVYREAVARAVGDLERTNKIGSIKDLFEDFFTRQAFDVVFSAMDHVTEQRDKGRALLAGEPKTFLHWRKLWDEWRTKGKIPQRQKALADSIRKEFVKKCQEVWQHHSEDFRSGDQFTQAQVIEKIKEAGQTTFARSKMIVETETTRYWNQVRKDAYSKSDDITHFMFIAIRDSATTEWCSDRTGLVYKKTDPWFERETPPIHWNCRSEIIPLSPLNPRHKALIDDKTRDRREHSCKALPKGWNKK